jgi:hypothetical protein
MALLLLLDPFQTQHYKSGGQNCKQPNADAIDAFRELLLIGYIGVSLEVSKLTAMKTSVLRPQPALFVESSVGVLSATLAHGQLRLNVRFAAHEAPSSALRFAAGSLTLIALLLVRGGLVPVSL